MKGQDEKTSQLNDEKVLSNLPPRAQQIMRVA
jgi:hypothetical protein